MNMLYAIFSHVLYSSLIASILILLLLTIKKIFNNRLSARFYHMIWILVLIRLLMPFEIESSFSILNLFTQKNQILTESEDHTYIFHGLPFTHESLTLKQINRDSNKGSNYQDFDENIQTQKSLASQNPEITANIFKKDKHSYHLSLKVFVQIWLVGFLVLALFSCFITISFKLRSRKFKKVLEPEIQSLMKECCDKLHIKKSIPIYVDSYFRSPCISGLRRPVIYLPEDFYNKIPYYQLQYILLHELAHYKRKDLFFNLFSILAALLHWFNPLVWLAVKEMRYDREINSDAFVMEILGENGVIPYGMTLIDLSTLFSNRHRQFNLVNFNETNSQMERRITMIKMFKKGSYKISAAAIICFLVIGTVSLTHAISPNIKDKPVTDANAGFINDQNITLNNKIKEKLVVIDPGHGGTDMGAIYPIPDSNATEATELREKDLNLDIALKLYDMLKKSEIKVEMTRQEDNAVGLEERVELANRLDASLLVSIHNNADLDSSKNGTSTWFNNSINEASYGITGAKAAQLIQEKLVKQLGTTDLGMSNKKLKILNDSKMPAVITDIAFITNDSDREKLMTEAFRIKAAQALYDGIIEVLNEMAASESSTKDFKTS